MLAGERAPRVSCAPARPASPLATEVVSQEATNKLHNKFRYREEVKYGARWVCVRVGSADGVVSRTRARRLVDMMEFEDTSYVVNHLWRNRSAVSGVRNGQVKMALTRWDADRPGEPDNVVLLTVDELAAFDVSGAQGAERSRPPHRACAQEKGRAAFDADAVGLIDATFRSMRMWECDPSPGDAALEAAIGRQRAAAAARERDRARK